MVLSPSSRLIPPSCSLCSSWLIISPHKFRKGNAKTMSVTHKIAVIGGDGTGPEVAAEGVKVLAAVAKLENVKFDLANLDWSGNRYLKTGAALPDDGLDQLRKFDAILLGAVGHPDVAPGILERKLLLDLRFGLD